MDQAKILLIGDDPNILRVLRRNLFGRGYDVFLALDDEETYSMISRYVIDLNIIMIDFVSSDVDGLAICGKLAGMTEAPMMVMSSDVSEKKKIVAFDIGADDYLVMPFNMDEFLARVRTMLRRWEKYKTGVARNERVILAGELMINTESRQVQVRGGIVKLTPTEYEILLYFANRRGKVVPHRELLRAIWGAEYGDEKEYIRVYISQLRRKLEIDPYQPVYIITEPGVGYRFIGEN